MDGPECARRLMGSSARMVLEPLRVPPSRATGLSLPFLFLCSSWEKQSLAAAGLWVWRLVRGEASGQHTREHRACAPSPARPPSVCRWPEAPVRTTGWALAAQRRPPSRRCSLPWGREGRVFSQRGPSAHPARGRHAWPEGQCGLCPGPP